MPPGAKPPRDGMNSTISPETPPGRRVARPLPPSVDRLGENFMAYTYLPACRGQRQHLDGASRYLDFQSKEAKQRLEAWVKLVKAVTRRLIPLPTWMRGGPKFMAGKVAMHISSFLGGRNPPKCSVRQSDRYAAPGFRTEWNAGVHFGHHDSQVSKNPEMAGNSSRKR